MHNSFENIKIIEIGLYLIASPSKPDLIMGVTLASFQTSGRIILRKEELKNSVSGKGTCEISAVFLSTLSGSYPVPLPYHL